MRRSTISSFTDSWAINRRKVVQRCPAVPTAPNRMPRTARSRSALGARIIALLPPSSRMQRAKRAATRGATSRPMRVLPVALTRATRRSSTSASPASRSPISNWLRCAGASPPKARAARSNSAWQASAVRGLLRRLPDHGITADQRQRGIPRPHRDWEVERADHAYHAQRVPGLAHVVAGTLGCDGKTVQLAREAHREVADIDHFLDFAEAFLGDLARLPGHQFAEFGLVPTQFLAEQPHQFTTARRRHLAPGAERLFGALDLGGNGGAPSSRTAARRLPSMGVCTASSPSRKALGSRPRLRSNPSIM